MQMRQHTLNDWHAQPGHEWAEARAAVLGRLGWRETRSEGPWGWGGEGGPTARRRAANTGSTRAAGPQSPFWRTSASLSSSKSSSRSSASEPRDEPDSASEPDDILLRFGSHLCPDVLRHRSMIRAIRAFTTPPFLRVCEDRPRHYYTWTPYKQSRHSCLRLLGIRAASKRDMSVRPHSCS